MWNNRLKEETCNKVHRKIGILFLIAFGKQITNSDQVSAILRPVSVLLDIQSWQIHIELLYGWATWLDDVECLHISVCRIMEKHTFLCSMSYSQKQELLWWSYLVLSRSGKVHHCLFTAASKVIIVMHACFSKGDSAWQSVTFTVIGQPPTGSRKK